MSTTIFIVNKVDYLCTRFFQGSVYFTADILAATDRLELLCRQSNIHSRGMDSIHINRSVCHAIGVLLVA